MTVLRIALLILAVVLTACRQQNAPQQGRVPPASCPVTVPPVTPFAPPSPYPSETGEYHFWLGTEKLWTILPKSGVWWGWVPRDSWGPGKPKLTEKIGWGSVDFDLHKEPYPALKVTGRRLDGDAPPLLTDTPTNATGPTNDNAEMAVGVYVPTPGCWEITGEYRGQKLSYVVWVTPEKPK